MTWQEQLQLHLDMFTTNKNAWTPEELQIAYSIWNGAHAEKFGFRRDTGCSSCRRSIVEGCRKLAQQQINNQE